jgi:predicted nucleic acid-binding protein
MSYLLDTNILLRAIQKTHESHILATRSVEDLLTQGVPLCITAQNVIEFWSVSTRAVAHNGLGLSSQETGMHVERFQGLFRFLPDTPELDPEWRRLVDEYEIQGVQVHDTRLVAVMKNYGLSQLLTFNTRHFTRYKEITVVHPEEVLRGSNRQRTFEP